MFLRMAIGVVLFAISYGLVALGDDQADAEPARAEMKKLAGTWQLLSAKKEGVTTPDETVRKIQVVIRDGKHTVFFDGQAAVQDIRLSCDPSTNPKSTVDTLPDGRTMLGIYRLEDDILTSCVAEPGQPRPKEFVAKEGTGHTLRVFKRVAQVAAQDESPPATVGPIEGAPAATKQAERSIAAGLNWLTRHQHEDGSWSLDHSACCKNGRCSAPGDARSDSAATALGLLSFLGAGQTPESKGPYRQQIRRGVEWLLRHQKASGDLSAGGSQMYSHGLATIALCESFGMTKDESTGKAAQLALDFIQSGQNAEGGWRYSHGSEDSDMSVTAWQATALKSGQLAGLKVKPEVFDALRKYLDLSATGEKKDRFGYTPKAPPNLSMTSAGLLVSQFVGAAPDGPLMKGGTKYLAENLPAMNRRNCYSFYYGTQVMSRAGEEKDRVAWTNAIRRLLIESQERQGCAAGSWDPEKPQGDAWGRQGGRLMVTSFSLLSLEVYYQHLGHHRRSLQPLEK